MKHGDLTWTEARDRADDVALLPAGSTEQHGPHAPLKTDTLIASRIADKTAEKTDTLCLPPIPIGVSEEHRHFAGTLYASPSTFRNYVSDILQSLAEQDIEHAIIVNGHGGNIEALQEVCARHTRDGNLFATEWTWWRAIDGMGHAGEIETSLLLHLEPGLVEDEREEGTDSWGRYVNGALVAYDSDEWTENGVVGDPTKASREKGEELFTTAVNDLTEIVEWVRENGRRE